MQKLALAIFALIAASLLAYPSEAQQSPEKGRTSYRPDSYDLNVCSFLEKTEELNSYIVKGAYFATKNDGTLVRLSLEEDGEMHVVRPMVSLDNGNSIEIGSTSERAADGQWRWSYNKRWLIHGGRAYILRFADGTSYLNGISRLTADFQEAPLCKFETSVSVFLQATEPGDSALCDAVAAGKPADLPASELATTVPTTMTTGGAPDSSSQIVAKLDADVANDGRMTTVYLYQMFSAAGRGCGTQYFDTGAGENAPLHQRLMAMQSLGAGEAPYCGRDRPRWFTLDGKTYLESLAQSADRPRAEEDEFHTVSTIGRGLPRIVCKADYSAKTRRILSVWTGDDWSEKGVVLDQR